MKTLVFAIVISISLPKATGGNHSEGKATLIRNDPNFHAIGFNADGHLLGYSTATRSFIPDDLTPSPNVTRGWRSPDEGEFFSGALSADGKTAALVFLVKREPGRLLLCDSRSGEQIGPEFDPAPAAFVAFSADGKTLAGLGEHEVFVFDASTGKLTQRMAPAERIQVSNTGIEFSPDGRFLRARNSYVSYLWDLRKSQMVGDLATGFYLEMSADWQLGAKESGVYDLRDPYSPKALARPLPEEARTNLNWISFSTDSRLIALQTREGTVLFWDVPEGRFLPPKIAAPGRRASMAFSPDRRYLAIYENDPTQRTRRFEGTVTLWEVESGRRLSESAHVQGLLCDWHFDPQGRFLAVTFSKDQRGTYVWKLPK